MKRFKNYIKESKWHGLDDNFEEEDNDYNEKHEFIDECPSYDEFLEKIKELRKVIDKLKDELDGDDNESYIIGHLIDAIEKDE